MPNYMVACYECGRKHDTAVPYVGLDADQIGLIDQGAEFPVYKHNLPMGSVPDGEQAKEIEQDGCFYDSTDYREVCGECGSDYVRDEEGRIIND